MVLPQKVFIELCWELKQQGTLVMTNGCFDLLHWGHVWGLQQAAAQGDFLVVAINSDKSVRRLKGPGRPIIPEMERAQLVGALKCVRAVTLFDEPTPRKLIAQVLPDVLVKGSDWKPSEIAGWAEVKAASGRLFQFTPLRGLSTSSIINKIKLSP